MKFSRSVFLAALATAKAGPISVVKKEYQRDLQSNSANGYYKYYGNGGQGGNYNGNYNYNDANYNAQYVEGMNEGNGNFQYNDADGSYDESYSAAGYFDSNGKFYYYGDNFDGDYSDASAQQYMQDWQNVGGVYGYYDADGNWVKNTQSSTTLPCQDFDVQQVGQYQANGGTYNYEQGEAYNGDVDYGDDADCANNTRIRTSNCQKSVVEVTKVNILCDSPYRGSFYSGHHMASQLCEYGDQAVVMVYFHVTEDLHYLNTMYMTLGVYAGKKTKELLWAVRAVELCNTFVGHDCTRAGSYAFAFTVSLDYGLMSDRSMFVPMIEMGISTRADEGYNLGGVNIDCKFNAFYQKVDPWYNGDAAHATQQMGAGGLGRYGWLSGLLIAVGAAGLFAYTRMKKGIDFQGNADDLVEKEQKVIA
jgi:hypothetical protein